MTSINRFIGWLLGLENVESIQQIRPSFTESWASSTPFLAFLLALALAVVGVLSYFRFEPAARGRSRWALSLTRGAILALLVIILAGPALTVVYTSNPKPLLYLLFDGSESMAIRDNFSPQQQEELMAAVHMPAPKTGNAAEPPRRMDYVQALLKREKNVIKRLEEKYRLRAFLFDGRDGVRGLAMGKTADTELDLTQLADELTTKGEVTALGTALEDLARTHKKSQLAGVVAFGDFVWNSPPSPLGTPLARLGVPVQTVGVGPEAALDLKVEVTSSATTKRKEAVNVQVVLTQSQLEGHSAKVRLTAIPSKNVGPAGPDASQPGAIRVGERTVLLTEKTPQIVLDFPFKTDESGEYVLLAEAEPLGGEPIVENNKDRGDLIVTDEFLRLFYAADEPGWEWRFVKEVFHRDPLVGMEGFRTYLRSSDPEVKERNPLFVESLVMPRSEFFRNDVLFLGDMSADALTDEYCNLVKEYVDTFGGGLVVMAGAVHGIRQLQNTPLADLLPVTVEKTGTIEAKEPFLLRRKPQAAQYKFMQLGATNEENDKAWNNLGPLNWYQPAIKTIDGTEVLAEHPTDKMANGNPQPLIAIRPYGNGEVVYIAFDEMWRLRRRYGERYYREFWANLIQRLGLRRAVGDKKRFVIREIGRVQEGDDVRLAVDAYDENFKPLSADRVAGRKLTAKVFPPATPGAKDQSVPLSVPFSKDGLFETVVPLSGSGEYRVVVTNPLTHTEVEESFFVERRLAERQSAIRNVKLQQDIASQSGGRPYDLTTVNQMDREMTVRPIVETTTRTVPLWATALCFAAMLALTAGEWIGRKMSRLP